jgi:eukaryotic-like serine/threonine-protein kinase
MSESKPPLGGKYRLLRPLAKGGMGKIWVGEHVELGTEVAIKRLHVEPERDDPWARFRREAVTLAQLKSRHIVHIYDLGDDADGPYIVMELLDGEDLSTVLAREGGMSPDQALRILEQVVKALSVAHQAGIVHRDIKPSNVFLAREAGEDERVVKVLDFGIAKQIGFDADATTLTGTGHLVGSPGYMSPEQIRGRKVDTRTDVWGVSALFYELLAGRSAFLLEHVGDTLFNICQGSYTPIATLRPELGAMDALFTRGFAPAPEDRFPNVQSLLETARQLTRGALASVRGEAAAVRPSPPSTASGTGRDPELLERSPTMNAFAGETRTQGAPQVDRRLNRLPLALIPLGLGVVATWALIQLWPSRAENPPTKAPESAQKDLPKSPESVLRKASPPHAPEADGVREFGTPPAPQRDAPTATPQAAEVEAPKPRPNARKAAPQKPQKPTVEPPIAAPPEAAAKNLDPFTGLPLGTKPADPSVKP